MNQPRDTPPERTPGEQQIYLSPEGYILESCDSLFPTEVLRGQPLAAVFPVLESCWSAFSQPENADFREFALPGVHLEFPGVTGIFDLRFLKVWLGQREAIFWFIAEKTSRYRRRQAEQQRRNERSLSPEFVEVLA